MVSSNRHHGGRRAGSLVDPTRSPDVRAPQIELTTAGVIESSTAIRDGTKVVIIIVMVGESRHKVLLVEDDIALGQLYRGVLRMSGFDAVHVSDGMAALNYLEREMPHLVVLDMNLPVVRGDEVLMEMAARADLRQIPAILVTGADTHLDRAVEQAKQILRKPCPPDRLVSVVERYVQAA